MRAVERAGYLAHSQTPAYQRRVDRARETIAEGLRVCRRPFVGFSAGKDSGVLLDLVLEQWSDAEAQTLTGGETRILYRNLDEVLDWWRARHPRLRLAEVHIDRVFTEAWKDATWQEQYDTFVDEWERMLWTTAAWDGVFLGLRADESNKRRLSLRHRDARGLAIHRYAANRQGVAANGYRICPLDHWSTADVAAYTVLHGLPLLEPYQVGGFEERTHLRTGRTSLRMGQLVELRQRDPAGYNRLIARFPELKQWT